MTEATEHEKGEKGMAQAADHAERAAPGWTREALNFLIQFARVNAGRHFLAEEVEAWATEGGCTPPPDKRAWGAVFKRANRAKIIGQTGFAAKNRLSGHDSRWSALWRVL